MDMEYTTLGRTNLKVSVAGLGAGGGSQLGLDRGKSRRDAIEIVRLALDLGVNVIDTAESYMTEEIIGEALTGINRSSVVLSTKHHVAPYRRNNELFTAEQVVAGLDESLRRLRTDYVDVYYLHALTLPRMDHAINVIAPALLRERDKGKFRFLGATEAPTVELQHEGMRAAIESGLFDVVMVGFQMFHQNARELVFPMTIERKIGTMLAFVVRNIFADQQHLRAEISRMAEEGRLPAELAGQTNPLDFLIHEGGARTLADAAYRFARHEPGADVVLFGTGDRDHLRSNVASILSPPLPAADHAKVRQLFSSLVGVGLDIPNRIPPAARLPQPTPGASA
jgi:aryl-alcohol dehydrogenase-like predicted oxidoreductase